MRRIPSSGEHGIPWGGAGSTICIDFDGTIFPWGDLDDGDSPPLPGAVEFVTDVFRLGWRVVIFTSRMSPSWWDEMEWPEEKAFDEQVNYIAQRLDKWSIPYHQITSEKVPARYYVDDRAVEFRGDWAEVERRVLG